MFEVITSVLGNSNNKTDMQMYVLNDRLKSSSFRNKNFMMMPERQKPVVRRNYN